MFWPLKMHLTTGTILISICTKKEGLNLDSIDYRTFIEAIPIVHRGPSGGLLQREKIYHHFLYCTYYS